MNYYERTITIKDYQGKWGKAVYVEQTQFVKTNNIAVFNKGKKIRFVETENARNYLLHRHANVVYSETEQLTDSKVWLRPHLHK